MIYGASIYMRIHGAGLAEILYPIKQENMAIGGIIPRLCVQDLGNFIPYSWTAPVTSCTCLQDPGTAMKQVKIKVSFLHFLDSQC